MTRASTSVEAHVAALDPFELARTRLLYGGSVAACRSRTELAGSFAKARPND